MALVPQIAQLLSKQKVELIAESRAGICAEFKDSDYADHGFIILRSPTEVLERTEIVIHISPLTFKRIAEFSRQSGKRTVSIGMTDSLWTKDLFTIHENGNFTSFSLDLMPRISRAQLCRMRLQSHLRSQNQNGEDHRQEDDHKLLFLFRICQ